MTKNLTGTHPAPEGPGSTLDHSVARLFTRWRNRLDRVAKTGTAFRNKLANVAATGLLAAALLSTPSPSAAAAEAERVNIIHIMGDDQAWWDLGAYGKRTVMTPNLDSLARGGVLFTRATPVCPLCAPARMSLVTGTYLSRFTSYPMIEKSILPVTRPNIGREFANAGYQTAYIGKTHFKISGSGIPNTNVPGQFAALGFTHTSMAHAYTANVDSHLVLFPRSIDTAVSFITANKDRPFVALVYITPTHLPLVAPQAYLDRVGGDVMDAMVAWVDDGIGRIVRTVDSLGIRGKTVIIYSADNAHPRSAPTYLGNKSSCYDEPVPFIVNWTGHYRAGLKINQVIQDVDLFPTLLDICGMPLPSGVTLDGRSFKPLLEEQPVAWRTSSYYECAYGRGVLSGNWKYIAVRLIPGVQTYTLENTLSEYGGAADLLFNMATDSLERNNLFADPAYADTLAAMKAVMSSYMSSMTYQFGEFNTGSGNENALPGYTKRTPASFTVYNIKGQAVRRYSDEIGEGTSGMARITTGLPNGVYAYKMAVNGQIYTGKKAVVR